MDSRAKILHGIQTGQMLFRSTNACARFYPVEDGQRVAKVFINMSPREEAEREYRNLQALQTLDARIRVPAPYEILEIGSRQPLMAQGLEAYGVGEDAIYAVVMEWIHGPSIKQLPPQGRPAYRPALHALLDALQDHHLFFTDLKRDHLLCMDTSAAVCLVDTHMMKTAPVKPDEYAWLRHYLDQDSP